MSSDTVPVYCPECGRLIQLPADKVGKMIECARCDTQFVAEEADERIADKPRPRRRRREDDYEDDEDRGRGSSSRAEVHIHQGGGGFNHIPHVILTLLTCGLWLPVWLIMWSGASK